MTALPTTDLQEIAQKLKARQQQLLQEIAAAEADIEAAAETQEALDPEELAQRQEAKEVRLGEIARDRDELASIGRALARIEAGDYGVCVACGKPIAKERLLARPESTHCVACKEALEAQA